MSRNEGNRQPVRDGSGVGNWELRKREDGLAWDRLVGRIIAVVSSEGTDSWLTVVLGRHFFLCVVVMFGKEAIKDGGPGLPLSLED